MKKLTVHVGTHKTGSTALQRFLNQNREWLKQNQVCYPTTQEPEFSHAPIAHALKDDDPAPLKQAIEEIENSGCKEGLLSSEDFLNHPGSLADALGSLRHQTTIILYVRRQDQYIQSLYQEFVKSPKHRYTETIETYLSSLKRTPNGVPRVMDLYGRATQWARFFDPHQILIRPYEKQQFTGGSLFSDFLNLLNVPHDKGLWYPDPSQSNRSLPYACVEFLRRTNHLRTTQEQAQLLANLNGRILKDLDQKSPQTSAGFLSPKQRYDILDIFTSVNQQVAKEFLKTDSPLFLEPTPDPDEPFEAPHFDLDATSSLIEHHLLKQVGHLKMLGKHTAPRGRFPFHPMTRRLWMILTQRLKRMTH